MKAILCGLFCMGAHRKVIEKTPSESAAIIPDANPGIVAGQWYHVVVTRNGDTFALYWTRAIMPPHLAVV
jgi:hypothetical protein